MGKYIASAMLTAFLSSTAFAGSDAPNPDDVKASFDRMLNHQPSAVVHRRSAERDVLQEVFGAILWTGAHPGAREPIANALSYRRSDQRPAGALVIEPASAPGQQR